MEFDEREVESRDGTRLFVRLRSGDERLPVLLFCDGLGCDGFVFERVWRSLDEALPLAHFHYRAHGRSAVPARPDALEIADLAGDLSAVRELLRRPVILVGHSLGVQVVLESLHASREGVRGLVLVNGTVGKMTRTFKGVDWLARAVPTLLSWAERFPAGMGALWSRVPPPLSVAVGRAIGDITSGIGSEEIVPYFEHLRHMDVRLFLRLLDASGRHSSAAYLAEIDAPALVLAGTHDTFTPLEHVTELARALPRCTLHVFPEATHLLPLEEAHRVAELLDRVARDSCSDPLSQGEGEPACGPARAESPSENQWDDQAPGPPCVS